MPLVTIILTIIRILVPWIGGAFIAYKVEQTIGDVTHPSKDLPANAPPSWLDREILPGVTVGAAIVAGVAGLLIVKLIG